MRYTATCNVIAIRTDASKPEHVRAIRRRFKDATSDIAKALSDADGRYAPPPDGHIRLDARLKLDFRSEEWPEFRRRLKSALNFAVSAAASRRALRDGLPHTCGTVLSIQLAPCHPPLLPAPTIQVVNPTSALADAQPGRTTNLTEREWQVASLVVAGFTRRDVAGRLRISESTVGTLLQRAYRKLDVQTSSGLRLRLEQDITYERGR